MKSKKIVSLLLSALILTASLSACSNTSDGKTDDNLKQDPDSSASDEVKDLNIDTVNSISERVSIEAEPAVALAKTIEQMNPLVSQRYSADPTSVEYNGRVYVYSTNDNQPYLNGSKDNDYGQIHTLNVFSSDDMVNWTDHGYINVKAIEPYCNTSWAPSIVKRDESDGLTHFYLFYALNGWTTGVLTSTDPLGPWSDPVGKAVICPVYPEVEGYMSNCFDPGAFVDDDGTIYVACGAGSNTDPDSKGSAIVELDDDLNIVGHPHVINAPYLFEASEFNKIGDKYVYTYNSNWQSRSVAFEGYTPSPICSMEYMISDSPTGPFTYKSFYFYNPGEAGYNWGNNHTHLQKFNGKWYIFHHTGMAEEQLGRKGGFRSVMVDEIEIDEETVTITPTKSTKTGVSQVKTYNPYAVSRATTMCTQAGISTTVIPGDHTEAVVSDINEGDWVMIKGVDFSDGTSGFVANVKGSGIIDIRLDDVNSATVGSIEFKTSEFTNIINTVDNITGTHDVYFLFGGNGWQFDSWQFIKAK